MQYTIPKDTEPEFWRGRPVLTTIQNGKVVLDKTLYSLWRIAPRYTLAEINRVFKAKGVSPLTIAAGLACLAEAGLLQRERNLKTETKSPVSYDLPQNLPLISAIIIAHNGNNWLAACIDSLLAQSYHPLEIILVDNCSQDGSAEWVRNNYQSINIIENHDRASFAHGINLGISASHGNYLLILNQDIRLDPNCVTEMFAAFKTPKTAAIAACLRFMWAPAFLNGIGNQVRTIGWGTDNAIGHLDLGQFDSWQEVPSVCFAAALIEREAWNKIGPIDEAFSMYYEDSEWSYRARLIGYRIRAAPRAIVYHAFGGRLPMPELDVNAVKLRNVVSGRLRFNAKLCNGWFKAVRLAASALQDLAGMISSFLVNKPQLARAYLNAWKDFIKNPPQKFPTQGGQAKAFFNAYPGIPQPHVWHELPELTWEMVCFEYLPLIMGGRTRTIPEFAEVLTPDQSVLPLGLISRFLIIWQGGGIQAVIRSFWRYFRWSLA